jgi:hypothetical protein
LKAKILSNKQLALKHKKEEDLKSAAKFLKIAKEAEKELEELYENNPDLKPKDPN